MRLVSWRAGWEFTGMRAGRIWFDREVLETDLNTAWIWDWDADEWRKELLESRPDESDSAQHYYSDRYVPRMTMSALLRALGLLRRSSKVDFRMALRVRNYVDNFHTESWRGRRFGSGDRLEPVLPIVLYTGESRWTAAVRVIDLVAPGASAPPGRGVSGAKWRSAPVFAGDGKRPRAHTMPKRRAAIATMSAAWKAITH